MAYKITLDFENNFIIWDTDNQKGTESCPDLLKRKSEILRAMGYQEENLSDIVNLVNAAINPQ